MCEIDETKDRAYYVLLSLTLRRSTRRPGVGTVITEQPIWQGRRIMIMAGHPKNRAEIMELMLGYVIDMANSTPKNVAGIRWTTDDVFMINSFTMEPWSV